MGQLFSRQETEKPLIVLTGVLGQGKSKMLYKVSGKVTSEIPAIGYGQLEVAEHHAHGLDVTMRACSQLVSMRYLT